MTAARSMHRRGSTAVIAMLFVILFAALAIGFFGAVTQSVQVAGNEQRSSRSMLAAESGMSFIRYQLAQVSIPPGATPPEAFDAVHQGLAGLLEGTANLGGRTVALSGDTITIPSGGGYVSTDEQGAGFRVLIGRHGSGIRVLSVGRHGDTALAVRAVQLDYLAEPRRSGIFDYGIASRGPINLTGNARILGTPQAAHGNVLSTSSSNTPLTSTGNTTISGHVSFTNPNGNVSSTGNISIGGSSIAAVWAEHVHRGVEEPEFPTFDASPFEPFATTLITSNPNGGNQTYTNVRIKAGVNPSFSGNSTIRGVMFIETPNRVTFTGNLTIQGVIVAQDNPTGTLSTNQINFAGNVSASGPETLPASFGELRNLTNTFLLAPNFALSMTGNFGTIGGSIVAGRISFTGNAGGVVRGVVLNTTSAPLTITGNAGVTIERPSGGGVPTGWNFPATFLPDPRTYAEPTL